VKRCAGFWKPCSRCSKTSATYARSAPAGARDHALAFETRVGDKQIEGCDFIQLDEDGAISAFTVMVRPMSGMLALAEAMNVQVSTSEATGQTT
jgi:hypothetical protein